MTQDGTSRETLVLIDGHGLVHRAYHAIRTPLSVSRTGEPTSAVYGFTSALLKTIADLQPHYLAVAFDHPSGPTLRLEQFEAYKAQRPSMPDDLRQQLPRIRQMVAAFHIPIYEIEGYEADDVIGTLARKADARGLHTVIVTGDTDLLQLATEDVDVLMQRSLQDAFYYTLDKVRERYEGLEPHQIIDLKALKGDPSDNIPGVAKVGEKTAIALLKEYGSVEDIYDNIEVIGPARLQENLRAGENSARQGKELVTIVTDLPIQLDMDQVRWGGYDREKVADLFRDLEFTSLLARLPKGGPTARPELAEGQTARPVADSDTIGEALEELALSGAKGRAPRPTPLPAEYRAVTMLEDLDALVQRIRQAGFLVFDTETTSTSSLDAALVGLAVTVDGQTGYYIPVRHQDGPQLDTRRVLDAVRPLFQDPDIPKIAHNAQYDISVLLNDGLQTHGLAFDTMLAAHLLGDNQVGLKPLAFQRLGVEMTPITDLIGRGGKQLSMDQVPIDKVTPYAGADAVMTYRLWEQLQRELHDEGLEQTFHDVEMPLVPVLLRMERAGIKVDVDLLYRMSTQFRQQLQGIEESIYHLAGERFNINSSQQLGVVLFDKMGLPRSKRTRTGYSTDASVLEGLQAQYAVGDPRRKILDDILDYRELSKLLSTYVDALPAKVNLRTGRIHTSFNQTGSATGRVASSDPNLQNIPVRTETGRRIRNAFVADGPDKLFLAADYSQVELRVLAHLSQDSRLMQAFEDDEDIHASTAAEVLKVPLQDVNADMRRIAKTINFGIVYGVTGFGLASRLEIDRHEADEYIKQYFERYPRVRDYIEATKQHARDKGYVQTLLGRRRYIPDIRSSNPNIRNAAERMAINMPVQGTAADVIKLAMIRLQDRLDSLALATRMLLQIHDELIFELPQGEKDQLAALVQEVMPTALPLSVPLKVDIKTGSSWGELE